MEIAAISPLPQRTLGRPKKAFRARVTNGSELLPDIDGRSIWARRCRDIISAHTADLGGLDNCSAAEQLLIRRFAQAAQAQKSAYDADLDLYQKLSNTLRRCLQTLGLSAAPKMSGRRWTNICASAKPTLTRWRPNDAPPDQLA